MARTAVGEVPALRFLPAAEHLVDGDQLEFGEALEIGRVGVLRRDRAVVVLGRDRLAGRRVEVLEIRLRDRPRAVLVDHMVDQGHGRLGADAERGHDDLELVGPELLEREKSLVLPGQQHVADATLDEGGGRAPGAGVEDRHVPVERGDELLRLAVIAARLAKRPAPGREVVPARAARGLRVGRDHLDVLLDQVAPIVDALRVALAHQEHDGRGVGRAVVRQARLPVLREPAAALGDLVDVVGERQRHHVGLEAIDHRPRLLAGAAVRLLDGDVLAGLLLPVLGERLVDLAVQLPGRIVGDVQNGAVGQSIGRGIGAKSQRRRRE
jgi:hypothetical protein